MLRTILGTGLMMMSLLTPPVMAQDRSQARSMVISRNGIVAAESPDGDFAEWDCRSRIAAGSTGRGEDSRAWRECRGRGNRHERHDGRSRADDEWHRGRFIRDRLRREGQQALWIECKRMGAQGTDD